MILQRIIINIALLVVLVSCCTINLTHTSKRAPEYKGVDPKAAPYVDMWLELAKQHGLKFNHTATVGFKDINWGRAIGLTNYGPNFREIDLDTQYWSRATTTTKTILVWHESCHAYCDRDHDYDKDRPYKKDEEPVGPGYFKDRCPVSIMTPQITSDTCFNTHYKAYVEDMLSRCDEW